MLIGQDSAIRRQIVVFDRVIRCRFVIGLVDAGVRLPLEIINFENEKMRNLVHFFRFSNASVISAANASTPSLLALRTSPITLKFEYKISYFISLKFLTDCT